MVLLRFIAIANDSAKNQAPGFLSIDAAKKKKIGVWGVTDSAACGKVVARTQYGEPAEGTVSTVQSKKVGQTKLRTPRAKHGTKKNLCRVDETYSS